MSLTQARLKELLDYDPATGVFIWRCKTSPRAMPGSAAGTTRSKGHRQITINKRAYLAHRLAWLYVTGEWPSEEIDHKNGQRADNRFANLREATRQVNAQNQRRARCAAGYLGVQKRKGVLGAPVFGAAIGLNGQTIWLGTFATAEAAHAAYVDAKRRLHEGNTL